MNTKTPIIHHFIISLSLLLSPIQAWAQPELNFDLPLVDEYGIGETSSNIAYGPSSSPMLPPEGLTLNGLMELEESPLNIGGWVQVGYHNRSDGLFNQHPNMLASHQNWLFLERAVDGSNRVDFGGRIDVMYGLDGYLSQSFGNRPGNFDYQNGFDHGRYAFAIPQLYAEVAYQDLSVKIGHFFTILGYEVIAAPDNFFYSHAMTMYGSEPFTHTGFVGSYQVDDSLTLFGGWTLGIDSGFDQNVGGSNFVGGFTITMENDATFTYLTSAGNLGAAGKGYQHSIVLQYPITERLSYVAQSDLTALDTPSGDHYDTVGFNSYLFYELTKKIKLGTRAEWWKADGSSYHAVTAGVNYHPARNFRLRPEIRYQWSPAHNRNNDGIVPVDEGVILGMDAVLTF